MGYPFPFYILFQPFQTYTHLNLSLPNFLHCCLFKSFTHKIMFDDHCFTSTIQGLLVLSAIKLLLHCLLINYYVWRSIIFLIYLAFDCHYWSLFIFYFQARINSETNIHVHDVLTLKNYYIIVSWLSLDYNANVTWHIVRIKKVLKMTFHINNHEYEFY